MRVDQKTLAAHRAAILEQAGPLFRRRGIDAVAVADITRAAGLTHGAFYSHFASKTALAAESCQHSLERAAERWRQRAAEAVSGGHDPLAALIDAYLSAANRDAPDPSCALAALGPEASRNPDLRPAMDAGVTALVTVLQDVIAARQPEADAATHARAALAVLAAMNGGLILARALSADPERSATALAAAAALAKRAAE
jgi:TetR/AcrR family transcriptional regulator, transcriptional repressor for nem operon